MREKATLVEIDTHYDLCDLLDINEALDVLDELEALNVPKTKKNDDRWT